MTETEDRVVEILTSLPPSHHPLGEPIYAVAVALGWEAAKTMAFIEYLMLCKVIVLKVEALAGPSPKPLWSWERAEAQNDE